MPVRLSILLPVFNGAEYIAETIDTVLAQTYQNWEVVIKDGGSKDGTLAILKEYADRDSRIRVYSEPDGGTYDAIHKAARLANGEFVCVLCASDGYMNKEWFASCVAVFERDKEVSLVWGIPFDRDMHGKIVGPNFNYAQFLQGSSVGERLGIVRTIFNRLTRPSEWKRILAKLNGINLTAAWHMTRRIDPPQKQEWFRYWLKTGIQFPDGNMCMSRRVLLECLPPYRPGEGGDWMNFYFAFNTRGYLAYCLPVPANFGRTGGAVTEKFAKFNFETRLAYLEKIKDFRIRINTREFKFRDRAGEILV